PLGTLDTEFRDLMCEELRHLHDRIKATTVYVTHDQLEAMSMADYIAIMNRGAVEQLGTLDTEFRDLMCDELRRLHERIRATTVYVTHDQLEAMSMADYIAIMNRGLIEQLGTPQAIYDRPATMFVAEFVGSPAMNLIHVPASLAKGSTTVEISGARVTIPETREPALNGHFVLGARPEHIHFDDSAKFRGEVLGTEYLGTTQIVTVKIAPGQVKARIPANLKVTTGEQVGLTFMGERLSLFDKATGAAIRTVLHEGRAHG
ncbi:MAG: TOBE domain-containing protein, partial [Rhizobiales bacterium]|nr:TOBE domain-containing protein [Hyphomicrobiales bacterium]